MYLRTVSKYKPPERLFIIGRFFGSQIYGACNPGDCKNGRATMRNFAVKLVSRGGGTPIHFLYGYVPPDGVVILKLLI